MSELTTIALLPGSCRGDHIQQTARIVAERSRETLAQAEERIRHSRFVVERVSPAEASALMDLLIAERVGAVAVPSRKVLPVPQRIPVEGLFMPLRDFRFEVGGERITCVPADFLHAHVGCLQVEGKRQKLTRAGEDVALQSEVILVDLYFRGGASYRVDLSRVSYDADPLLRDLMAQEAAEGFLWELSQRAQEVRRPILPGAAPLADGFSNPLWDALVVTDLAEFEARARWWFALAANSHLPTPQALDEHLAKHGEEAESENGSGAGPLAEAPSAEASEAGPPVRSTKGPPPSATPPQGTSRPMPRPTTPPQGTPRPTPRATTPPQGTRRRPTAQAPRVAAPRGTTPPGGLRRPGGLPRRPLPRRQPSRPLPPPQSPPRRTTTAAMPRRTTTSVRPPNAPLMPGARRSPTRGPLPTDYDGLLSEARRFEESGRVSLAVARYRQALLVRDTFEARLALVESLVDVDPFEAWSHCEAAVREFPNEAHKLVEEYSGVEDPTYDCRDFLTYRGLRRFLRRDELKGQGEDPIKRFFSFHDLTPRLPSPTKGGLLDAYGSEMGFEFPASHRDLISIYNGLDLYDRAFRFLGVGGDDESFDLFLFNDKLGWRRFFGSTLDDIVGFGYDYIGNVFCFDGRGEHDEPPIIRLDCDTGELEPVADNFVEFLGVDLTDKDEDVVRPRLLRLWQNECPPLSMSECLSYKTSPMLGGERRFENLTTSELNIRLHMAGQICQQAKKIPDGARILGVKIVNQEELLLKVSWEY